VSAVQLRHIRDEFSISLVRRQFLIRALLDDTVSAETSRVVSTTSSVDSRTQRHWSGVAALQFRSVDVGCRADAYFSRRTRSSLPGMTA